MAKKDFALAAAVLAAAAAIHFFLNFTADTGVVVVSVDSNEYGRYPLDESAVIDINGTNKLVIENGAAYISEADCPDKICVNTGRIRNSAKSIVCLPNKVVVTIDKKDDGLDAVAQ